MSALHPDKRPFRVISKHTDGNGARHVVYEADFWEGPDGSGNETGYRTLRGSASLCGRNQGLTTCSFWPQLRAALNA